MGAHRRVPPPDLSPFYYTSTISRAKTGGRNFVFYQASQSAASGPYTEVIDWGDGTSSRATRANLNDTMARSHVYAANGTFWIRIYVKDSQGRWGVAERKLTVTP